MVLRSISMVLRSDQHGVALDQHGVFLADLSMKLGGPGNRLTGGSAGPQDQTGDLAKPGPVVMGMACERHGPIATLAFPEQLPRGGRILIYGIGPEATWTLNFLRERGIAVEAFICDAITNPGHLHYLPVIWWRDYSDCRRADDIVIIASPHRNEIIQRLPFTEGVWDATFTINFLTDLVPADPCHVGDLGITYWRIPSDYLERLRDLAPTKPRWSVERFIRTFRARVGTEPGHVVNIGCHDGQTFDPCYPLFKDGHPGLAMDVFDSDSAVGQAARRNLTFDSVALQLGTFVTPENITDLLSAHNVPMKLDVVKIDIDSFDGALLERILDAGWRPRLICVEVNADIPPPFGFSMHYSPEFLGNEAYWWGVYGISPALAARIASKYGYDFLAFDFGYPDMISGIRDMMFIDKESARALDMGQGMSWIDAYYLEPLAYSHFKGRPKVDPREWRHTSDPAATLEHIRETLDRCCVEAFGKIMGYDLDVLD
ncbi:MAG: hypothetical protein HC888_06630 [Candidatus Competibacteraceae bacterium]|nr:hypothetical protein [Candidatus Competibacteraceae bacterium]